MVRRRRPLGALVRVWVLLVAVAGSAQPVAAQGDGRIGVNPAVTQVRDAETTTTTTNSTLSATAPSGVPTSLSPGPVAPVPVVDATAASTQVPVVSPAPQSTLAPANSVPVAVPTTSVSPVLPSPTTKVPKDAPPARSVAELRQRIDAILDGVPGVAASVSIDGLGTVYDRNGDRSAIPASTQKIYTIGAVLLRFGGDKRFVTDIRSSVLVEVGGLLPGDLVIRASGDPSFSSAGVNALADAVLRSGVREITGDLVVDESHFDSRRANEGWKPSFIPGEVGSLSAFTVNGNHSGGKVTRDPAVANLGLVRAALTKRKIVIRGTDRTGRLPLGGPVLGSVSSAPLRDLAAYAMKKSDNTYAELLLKELGSAVGNGSAVGGIELVRQQFAIFGVPAPVMADGSGLSSFNRSTPAQQVAWLTKLQGSASAQDFRASLPGACVDGTMKNRFCKTAGAGMIQAKTGTLDNITALSGYATMSSGKDAVFSFVGNGLRSTSKARVAIDQAVLQVVMAALP